MSPLLFQRLIKTLSLLLMAMVIVSHSSIFDHINSLESALEELDRQNETMTEPVVTTTASLYETISDTNETIEILPGPLSVGLTMNPPDSDEINVVTVTGRNPQPFTILMNFQNDGTMSLMVYNQDSTSWTQQGRCRHGQMYDPVSNVCRDVFCAQGYVLRPQGKLE